MNADIQSLFHSPLASVFDFKCRERAGSISKSEWRKTFNIIFTRKGNYGYRLGRKCHDIHSGVILLENAKSECVVSHEHHVKDECTSLTVRAILLNEMYLTYSNPKLLANCLEQSCERFEFPAIAIRSTPEIEYLHWLIYQIALDSFEGRTLKIDLLVIALLKRIFADLTNTRQLELPVQLDKKSKDLHLDTIDRAKNYIFNNFQNDLSLFEIARNAYVSPFHFSRLFKHFTSYSPYQYLLEVRLKHAVLLLRNTSFPITEICFESGFNSLEHFIATFTHRYRRSPLKFRHQHS